MNLPGLNQVIKKFQTKLGISIRFLANASIFIYTVYLSGLWKNVLNSVLEVVNDFLKEFKSFIIIIPEHDVQEEEWNSSWVPVMSAL